MAVRFKSYLDSKGVLISKLRIFGRLIEYSSSIQIRYDFFMWINCAKRFQHYADVFQPSLSFRDKLDRPKDVNTWQIKKKTFLFFIQLLYIFLCVQNYHPLWVTLDSMQTMSYLYAKSAKWAQIPYFSHNGRYNSHFFISFWHTWCIRTLN